MALRSGVRPLMHGARRRPSRAADNPAHFRFPPGTPLIVGINNTSSFTKRMPRGFRSGACFLLKIHAAFPGTGR